MSARAILYGIDLQPGFNVDRIDVAAGLKMLAQCGHTAPETHSVIEYALARWMKGEEEAAQRGAIDRSFHGIDLTSWLMVLATARAAAETEAAQTRAEPTGAPE